MSKRALTKARINYSAKDIEVLEGIDPVRKRPGMYVGSVDKDGLHHLFAEVLDNAMDEVVAGFASLVKINLSKNQIITIQDNGRGIPVDPHPKFKNKSALEVILTTLHTGGKFSEKVYKTAGGLHGVGISVVNALSDYFMVEVARDGFLWSQEYCRGKAKTKIKKKKYNGKESGTTISFHPDPEIFKDESSFLPNKLYQTANSKCFLFPKVKMEWSCDNMLIKKLQADKKSTPAKSKIHYPGGILEYMNKRLKDNGQITEPFYGKVKLPSDSGSIEWAISWLENNDTKPLFKDSFCNTVPTPEGGSHEAAFKSGLMRSIKSYGNLINLKDSALISSEDMSENSCFLLSAFIRNPQFFGQTKNKLTMPEIVKTIENSTKDYSDIWLSKNPRDAKKILNYLVEVALQRKQAREAKLLIQRSSTRKIRLPGKLSDCTRRDSKGTELFIVEGDSAGGSAKQARNRETQAVLPLKGKILNVANASTNKLLANQELQDLNQALGCGTGTQYEEKKLRYEKIIIMTDADVDGAHIASLLMTYFYQELPKLIENGHLYLAAPPLYRMTKKDTIRYAHDEKDKDNILKNIFNNEQIVEISRFKGLGEMPAKDLKDTTMNPETRQLFKVSLTKRNGGSEKNQQRTTAKLVESLMGRKPELRLEFIKQNAKFIKDLYI
jgi:topoisomerase-4 subunit B